MPAKLTQKHRNTITAFVSAFLFAGVSFVSAQTVFQSPLALTDSSEIFQLSRNSNNSAAFDSNGRLHVTYWSGEFSTTPDTPSFVYYQNWTLADGFSSRESIDDSFYDNGTSLVKYGGRHPSLAIRNDDSVYVTWHDSRHADPNPPAGAIDNLEIYLDVKPSGGSFSSTDIRISNTSAVHLGDNSYNPSIIAKGDGSISILWHDFNFDPDVSDIFNLTSDTNGSFTSQPILNLRLTDADDRTALPFIDRGYSLADHAVDNSYNIYSVWTNSYSADGGLYFAEIPSSPAIVSEQVLNASVGGFFDPPKITAAPNGDLWIFATRINGSEKDLIAYRKLNGQSNVGTVINLSNQSNVSEFAVDGEIDSLGQVHLSWIEGTTNRSVHYGLYDPNTSTMIETAELTETVGDYQRTTLVLDSSDRPYIFFDSVGVSSGDVYFVAPAVESSAEAWNEYE